MHNYVVEIEATPFLALLSFMFFAALPSNAGENREQGARIKKIDAGEFWEMVDSKDASAQLALRDHVSTGMLHVDGFQVDKIFERLANRSVAERSARNSGKIWGGKLYSNGTQRVWPGQNIHWPAVWGRPIPNLGIYGKPLYPEDFDWGEERRVAYHLELLQAFIDHHAVEDVWTVLTKSLSDSRYCICIASRNGHIGKAIKSDTTHRVELLTVDELCWRACCRVVFYPARLAPWQHNNFEVSRSLFRDTPPQKLQIHFCEFMLKDPRVKELAEPERAQLLKRLEKELSSIGEYKAALRPTGLILPAPDNEHEFKPIMTFRADDYTRFRNEYENDRRELSDYGK